MCEKCGESLTKVEKKDSFSSDKVICPECGLGNNTNSKICKFCNAAIPTNATVIKKTDNYNNSYHEYNSEYKQPIGKIGIIIICYIAYLVLIGLLGEIFAGPVCIASVICGWYMLSRADSEHWMFLGGLAGWMDAGGSGCGGILFLFVAKFFLSFFVGLFLIPILIGTKIYDAIF